MKAFDAALGAWPGLCGIRVKPLRFTKLFKLPEIKYFNALDYV
jgi:hypothetical protein